MKAALWTAALAICLPGQTPTVRQTGRDRLDAIPPGSVKMTPATDAHPPIMHSAEFGKPMPLGPAINTAGAEDSPFITPDGDTLYFWFTPDVSVPANKQLFDGVTGIWVSHRSGGAWSKAERVLLQEPGKLALDGAPTVRDNTLWFVSAREGYEGVRHFTAKWRSGRWTDVTYAGDRLCREYQVGELHIARDGTMYCHSTRAGGRGGLDIWSLRQHRGEWQQPVNVAELNTDGDEGWPFVSEDGREFWFLRTYRGSPALFRSKRTGSAWAKPELMVSQFAGEPTLDGAGNLYFVHHYYRDSKMLEADIYFAPRIRPRNKRDVSPAGD
jgi:hypothetical protein